MPPSTVECLAVLHRTTTSGIPKIGSHGSISKRIQKTLFQEMLHMLPYPQSCQGQRKDREEAKDILAECQGITGFSVDWINNPNPLGEHSIVTGSDKLQAMILRAWGLSCSAV